jgi:hypothetical protein
MISATYRRFGDFEAAYAAAIKCWPRGRITSQRLLLGA